MNRKTVLFVCPANSARSQMAEAPDETRFGYFQSTF